MRKRLFLSLAACLIVASTEPAHAQVKDPFETVTSFVDWFGELNRIWADRVVEPAVRAQLVRSVDRLRKNLYSLQGDTELLLQSIPEGRPDELDRQQMITQINDLRVSVNAFRQSVISVSADLGSIDPNLPKMLVATAVVRAATLNYLDEQLQQSRHDPNNWKPSEMRGRLKEALGQIDKAQASSTLFRNKLSAQR